MTGPVITKIAVIAQQTKQIVLNNQNSSMGGT